MGARTRLGALLACLCILCASAGCGTVRETLPARSALEQFLISTAADRAAEKIPAEILDGRMVFIDTSNLDCYDKPYVVQRIRQAVLHSGAHLATSREDAEIVLEAASGGLSINKRDYLLGIPELPLPIPFAGQALKLPEVPLFKAVFSRGRAKLLFSALDPETNTQLYEVPVCYGKSLASEWWVLLFGPFGWSDLPKGAK